MGGHLLSAQIAWVSACIFGFHTSLTFRVAEIEFLLYKQVLFMCNPVKDNSVLNEFLMEQLATS